jgi:hypothetical protein
MPRKSERSGGDRRRRDPAPTARRRRPVKPQEAPDQLADKVGADDDRQAARLEEALEESFPASDPPSAHHIT